MVRLRHDSIVSIKSYLNHAGGSAADENGSNTRVQQIMCMAYRYSRHRTFVIDAGWRRDCRLVQTDSGLHP